MKPRILLIEDDTSIASGLQKELRAEGYDVVHEARGDTGLERALADDPDVVISDMKMPGLNGIELIRQLHDAKPKLPIILITAHGTTETAIEATKLGAFDYLLKPFEMPDLLDLTTKAVAARRLMSEPVAMQEPRSGASAIVGRSRAMQDIYKEIGRVAATSVTVLIRGETGTGKELVARAIYQYSDRAHGPFVAVNCAAVPETLLESELFGHERGAFTGADARRIGRFEQAHGGTLFLDEIGDMTLSTQAKLLRVLQDKVIQRVGGKEPVPVDVRILAATHRDLETAMAERQFREDLFFRLSAVTVKLPPLRDRRDDIPELVSYFVQRLGAELGIEAPTIQPEAVATLKQQPWPGNVRELQNVVRQLLLLSRGFPISSEHIGQIVGHPRRSDGGAQTVSGYIAELLGAAQRGELENAQSRMVEDMERELYSQAIRLAEGNQAKAARWLGVTRVTMREKLLHFGLHPAQERLAANDTSSGI